MKRLLLALPLSLAAALNVYHTAEASIPPGSCFARSKNGNTSWDQYCMAGKGETDIFGLPRLEGWWFKYNQSPRPFGPFVSYVHPRPSYVLDKYGRTGRFLEFRHIYRHFKKATAGTAPSISFGDTKTRCKNSGSVSIRQQGSAFLDLNDYNSRADLSNLNFENDISGQTDCTTSYGKAAITPGSPGEPGRIDLVYNSQIVDCSRELVLNLNTDRDWSKAKSFRGEAKGSWTPMGIWYRGMCELRVHTHFPQSKFNYLGSKNRL